MTWQRIAPVIVSVFVIIPTPLFVFVVWLAARAGWGIVASQAAYVVWGVSAAIMFRVFGA